MKIFLKVTENKYYRNLVESIKTDFPEVKFVMGKDKSLMQKELPDSDAVVAGRFYDDEIEMTNELKALFIPFSGTDAFDIAKLTEKGVQVANSHGASPYIAERAVGLAISLLGRIVEFDNDLRRGFWHRRETWQSIQDLTCGIWGVGRIGKEIARILSAFGTKINGLVRDNNKNNDNFDNFYTNRNQFIQNSDLFFICLPLTRETRGLISSEIFEKMSGKYLVHISRGPVVDEDALYKALDQDILAGAALDVWFNYPRGKKQPVLPSNRSIHKMKNVVLSPHACSHTETAREANIKETEYNLRYFIETGKTPPKNTVDPVRNY